MQLRPQASDPSAHPLPFPSVDIMDASPRHPQLILHFPDRASAAAWLPVHDRVMGGVSSGGVRWNPGGTATFAGELSLAFGGGFASARVTLPAPGLREGWGGVTLRCRGDGRRYSLRLYTDDTPPGVSYRSDFETRGGEWEEFAFPYISFHPVRRGRPVQGAPPLGPERVRQVGILVADGQAGPFALELEWLRGGAGDHPSSGKGS